MKKTFIAIALAAVIPAAVLAASDHEGSHRRGPNVERLAERLDLSAEQQERVRALFEAHRAERDAMRQKMKAAMAEVLTPEQQARMDSMREERREKRMQRRKRHTDGRHGKDCGPAEGATRS